MWKKIGSPPLTKSNWVVWGVSGKKLNFRWEFMCHISFLGKTLRSKVYVKNTFPHVFSEGLGKCVKTKVKFKLKENVKLVFKPNKKVLF